ncbi:MAG TPA: hypothetical protein VIN61_03635 [Gammaproteobacteria bacterium]
MSGEQEIGPVTPGLELPDDVGETLTDLIDRIDREAFRRALGARIPSPASEPEEEAQ